MKVPQIVGPWWTVAHDPDLGELTNPKQQPVDFCVWQAGDGTWQLWSCIRNTLCGGNTRLLYGWEGKSITDPDWTPKGIAMQADPAYGETPGGLQAPYVTRHNDRYLMFYGDWINICLAESSDGKVFNRRINSGTAAMFTEGEGKNNRDPMAIIVDGTWYCYYTVNPQGIKDPNGTCAVFCRISGDLISWSESRMVAFGGSAGMNLWSAECPFVVKHETGYYLFRTQRYGENAQTSVYYSTDPLDFGINDDSHLICTLPIAAPEIVHFKDEYYVACLLSSLKGIQIARLAWI